MPETLCEKRKKFGIVDGANARNIQRALQKGRYKFRALHNMLLNLGTCHEWFQDPQYVTPPNTPPAIQKAAQASGFHIELRTTQGSQDDIYIKQQLQMLKPEKVGVIVIVSGDFGAYSEVLYEKAKDGVEIYVVASRKADQNIAGFSDEAYRIVQSEDRFHFIDLADYADEIMEGVWVGRTQEQRTSDIVIRRFSFAFRCPPNFPVEEANALLLGHFGCFTEKHGIRKITLDLGERDNTVLIELPNKSSVVSGFMLLITSFFMKYGIEEIHLQNVDRR